MAMAHGAVSILVSKRKVSTKGTRTRVTQQVSSSEEYHSVLVGKDLNFMARQWNN